MRHKDNTTLKEGEHNKAFACLYHFGVLSVFRVTADNYKVTKLLPVFDNKNEAIEHYKSEQRASLTMEFKQKMEELNKQLSNLEIKEIE